MLAQAVKQLGNPRARRSEEKERVVSTQAKGLFVLISAKPFAQLQQVRPLEKSLQQRPQGVDCVGWPQILGSDQGAVERLVFRPTGLSGNGWNDDF